MTDFIPFAPIDAEPFYPAQKASTDARRESGAPAQGRRDSAEQPVSEKNRKNFAAEAAMKLSDMRFRRFLADRHGLAEPLTPERATQRLRSVLGITSRRELNDDHAAAARWKDLRREFDGWLKAGATPDRWRGDRSRDSAQRYGGHRG